MNSFQMTKKGESKVADVLIENEANVNIAGSRTGWTPLQVCLSSES